MSKPIPKVISTIQPIERHTRRITYFCGAVVAALMLAFPSDASAGDVFWLCGQDEEQACTCGWAVCAEVCPSSGPCEGFCQGSECECSGCHVCSPNSWECEGEPTEPHRDICNCQDP